MQVLASAGGDCTVRVHSVTDQSTLAIFEGESMRDIHLKRMNFSTGHAAAVTCVRFSPDGKQLFAADGGGLMKVWQLGDKTCTLTIEVSLRDD